MGPRGQPQGHGREAVAGCAGDSRRRDTVMVLLSVKAGLRATEIAALTWAMVTEANGQSAAMLHLEHRASKGRRGGRLVVCYSARLAENHHPWEASYLISASRSWT